MKKKLIKKIEIPEKTELKLELPKIIVSGPLGSIEKKFKFKGITIKNVVGKCKKYAGIWLTKFER